MGEVSWHSLGFGWVGSEWATKQLRKGNYSTTSTMYACPGRFIFFPFCFEKNDFNQSTPGACSSDPTQTVANFLGTDAAEKKKKNQSIISVTAKPGRPAKMKNDEKERKGGLTLIDRYM